MPVRIRLQRHGKKGAPFYHIVVADGRAPRDGSFIEKLGTYNPMKNPAEILLDIDKSVQWLRNGAQPSDTVRSILSHKGVMMKHHLLKGVDKGALTTEQAEVKFEAWLGEKQSKIQKVKLDKDTQKREDQKARLDAESKLKDAKSAVVAAKKSDAIKAAADALAPEEVAVEAPVAEAPIAEAPVAEAPVAEAPVAEAPVAEAPVAEAPVAE